MLSALGGFALSFRRGDFAFP